MSLTLKLGELARKRKQAEELSAKRDVLQEAVDEYLSLVPEYIELESVMQTAKILKAEIDELEKTIRTMATTYSVIPSGVTVKTFKTLNITNEKQAKVWLATNAPTLISYTPSKVLKAVENLEIDWATVEDEKRAQIASNLSEYLDE